MTQVCQHYAHTFHFHYESDPTLDRLTQFVWSKNACTPKMVKIARLFQFIQKSSFLLFVFFLLLLFSFDWCISKPRQDTGVKLCYAGSSYQKILCTFVLGPEHSCAVKKGRRQVNKKFFELKNVKYRDGIKSKETRQG